jgi:hypothetical protein
MLIVDLGRRPQNQQDEHASSSAATALAENQHEKPTTAAVYRPHLHSSPPLLKDIIMKACAQLLLNKNWDEEVKEKISMILPPLYVFRLGAKIIKLREEKKKELLRKQRQEAERQAIEKTNKLLKWLFRDRDFTIRSVNLDIADDDDDNMIIASCECHCCL